MFKIGKYSIQYIFKFTYLNYVLLRLIKVINSVFYSQYVFCMLIRVLFLTSYLTPTVYLMLQLSKYNWLKNIINICNPSPYVWICSFTLHRLGGVVLSVCAYSTGQSMDKLSLNFQNVFTTERSRSDQVYVTKTVSMAMPFHILCL